MTTIKAYCVRVLEIEKTNGSYFYTQVERGKKYGPFVDIPALVVHLNKGLLREILLQFRKQLH
jgi:hypothetical protein